MNTYLILALAVLANVVALVAIACHYRAVNKRQAATHAEVIALKDDAIEEMGTRCDNLRHSATVWRNRADDLRQAKADLAIRLDNTRAELNEKTRACAVEAERWDRMYALPTIEGNLLDLVESLPVGHRLDFADFTTATPIGLGVMSDHIASVVPIRGAKR
jgi:hypothetical protein